MHDPRLALRGRGTSENPANRFERIRYAVDRDREPDETPSPATQFLSDPSRSIVATNSSPDVGFDFSVNPYRGCEHGCIYCLAPETPVLHADMVWRPLGEVRVGDRLVGFDESPDPGRTRKLRPAVVEAVWWSRKATRRLVTPSTEVVTTADHRWLQARDFRWWRTEQLQPGNRLRHMPVSPIEVLDDDYRVGYIAGLSLGDGTFRYEPGWRSDKLGFPAAYWRVALIDREPLLRTVEFLRSLGVDAHVRPFSCDSKQPMWKVEIRSLRRLELIHKIVRSELEGRSYRRGFLAGFFDAEGYHGDSLRISQVDLTVLERVQRYARSLGFEFRLEPRSEGASTLRLVGSVTERMRFLGVAMPAIRRKIESAFGTTPALQPEPVEVIEKGPIADVVDIQTSTGTFYAAGLATHNCYARPSHEYLGFSAGLDFETKILVKKNAPGLLWKKLASLRWKPAVVALSGVTDPYQPIERKLELTRACLHVLLAFRNPVSIITKNRLVTRDLDVLEKLAAIDGVVVTLSITTLDASLQRIMEPRTSAPRLRLQTIEELAKRGIPVGVNVAPVIPGLNDHEIPAILEAAAGAGAGHAGYLLLRLPHAVSPLFQSWLERHLPERKDKVLNRIRQVRGGRLNDPRFGARHRGTGLYASQIQQLFSTAKRRAGIPNERRPLSTAHFRRPAGHQLSLFE